MESLQERVQLRMEQIGLTQTELSTIINKSSVTIYKILSGNQHNLMGDTLVDLSEALRCNPVWLQRGVGPITIGGGDGRLPFMKNVPILTERQLKDYPDYIPETTENTSYLPCFEMCSSQSFWIRVQDDDLYPRFEPADLICVDPKEIKLYHGKHYVIRIKKDKSIALRRVIHFDGEIYLKSTNPIISSNVSLTGFNDDKYEIVGKIVSLIKSV